MGAWPRAPALGEGGLALIALRIARSLTLFALSVGVLVGVWYGAIRLFNLDPYFAKDPGDVWSFVVSGPGAGANRAELARELTVTLRDAASGYAVGTAIALLVAILFVLWSGLQKTFMPAVLALRSVPLVAMTPLITLVFGRGLLAVSAIGTIVTFFPTVVFVSHGLRASPAAASDLVRAYGGGRGMALRKVQLPHALPALFAAARVAVPASLVGALLAEWLATGDGLGYLMVQAIASSSFDQLWAAVVLITVVSALAYALVSSLEGAVLSRFGNA